MPAGQVAEIELVHPTIKKNGSDVPDTLAFLTVEVENLLYGASEATMVLSANPEPSTGSFEGADFFDLGDEIEIAAKPPTGSDVPLFKGEVVGVDFEYDPVLGGSLVRVRALDKFHRLWRGTKLRTFLEQKVSDIASSIISGAGLSADVASTSTKHKWLIQNNVSDGEYLLELAAQEGLVVWADAGKVHVKLRSGTFDTGPSLVYGEHLHRLRVSHSAAAAVSKVTVNGWDPKAKQEITGQASTYKALGESNTTPSSLTSKFGDREAVIADSWLPDQSSATTAAQALLDQLGDAVVRVDGESFFVPDVKVATLLALQGFGTKFSGKFFVSAVRHRFSGGGEGAGATTEFICAGPVSESFAPFGAAPSSTAGVTPSRRIPDSLGPMIAIVTDANDPEKLGRVKVKFPQLGRANGSDVESDWLRYVTPMGGNGRGLVMLPNVNDEVVVVFEQGLIERGLVIGGVWSSTDVPPSSEGGGIDKAIDGGNVKRWYLRTSSGGAIFEINETSDKPGILLIDKDKNYVKILTQDKKLEMADAGGNKVTIDGQAKKISLESMGDVEIKAQQKVTITGTTGVSIESSGGNFDAKGMQATVQGQTQASVKGATASLEGQGQATVKAAMVMIN